MTTPLLAALFLTALVSAQLTSAQSPQADVARLVRAAEQLTSAWPSQPPPAVREVGLVARHGRTATPLLIALLSDDPEVERDPQRWRTQQQATLALARIYSESAHCGRVYCDGDRPERIRQVKGRWLETIASDAELRSLAVTELLDRFKQERVFWRQFKIGQTLADKADRGVIPELESWLAVDDRHLRGNAAFVLARLGDGRGFDVIAGLLRDRSPRAEGQGVPTAKWSETAQIRSDRYYAAHLLGDLKDPGAVDLLLPLIRDDDLSHIIPWSLAQIGDHRAIGPLIEMLDDDTPSIRMYTIAALEQLNATEALPRLRTLLQDQSPTNLGDPVTVAQAAHRAIVAISSSSAR